METQTKKKESQEILSRRETYYILYTSILSIYKGIHIDIYIYIYLKAEKQEGTLRIEPVTVNTSERNSLYITLAKGFIYRRRVQGI